MDPSSKVAVGADIFEQQDEIIVGHEVLILEKVLDKAVVEKLDVFDELDGGRVGFCCCRGCC